MTNLKSILLGSAAAMTLAVGPAWSQTTEPVESVTEEAGDAGEVIVQGAEEVGEAGANVVAEGTEAAEGVTPPEIAEGRWAETYGERYGEFGDRNVEELVGTDVVSAEGNNIGEVDNFVLMENQLAAVVGIGGFLGIGEHNVALALNELTWNGEQLVVEGYTEDQLRELPAYDEAGGTVIGAGTLREGYNTAGGEPMQQPATEGQTEMTAGGTAAPAEGESTELQVVEQEIEQEAQEVQSAEAGAATEGGTDLTEQAQETAEATVAPVEGSTEMAAGTTAPEAGATNLTEQAGGSGTVPLESAEAETETAAAVETEQPVEEPTETAIDATTPPAETTAETAMTTEEPTEGATEMAATEAPTEEPAETAAVTTEEPAEGETEIAAAEAPTEGETETANVTVVPTEGTAEGTAEMAAAPAAEGTEEMAAGDRWSEDMNNVFGDIADRQVAELIGTDVAGSDGEVIGQVDNFALQGDQVVAVVGVGGFLGLGKHNVGLPLDQLTWDGERLVLSGMTEEDLRNMPAYDEDAGGAFIEGESTLRGTYNQM